MIGASGVRRIAADFLTEYLPSYIAAMKIAEGVGDTAGQEDPIPTPLMPVFPHEPPSMGKEAADPNSLTEAVCGVGCTDTLKLVRQNVTEAGDPYYDVWYQVVVYLWAKSQTWGGVIVARDNLVTATRECMLSHQALGAHGVALIDENTIRETFTLPEQVVGGRHMAGCGLGVQVRVTESLTSVPIGVVETVALTGSAEPLPHPALS